MDVFGAPIPSFNIKGESYIGTITGGLCSILFGVIAVLFASLKLQIMLSRSDTVTTITKRNGFNSFEDRIQLSDGEFAMALGIQSHSGDGAFKDDPRFVKWILRYTIEIEHVKTQKYYPLHRCKESDFAAFF